MITIKQQQVASIVHKNIAEVFHKNRYNSFLGAFITISRVEITPALLIAKVYITILNHSKPLELIQELRHHLSTIKKLLVSKIKNKMRQMPTLELFYDNSLDRVFQLESVFSQISLAPTEKEYDLTMYKGEF